MTKNNVFTIIILFTFIFFDPFNLKEIGGLRLTPPSTVSVVGEASTDVANKIASFDVGVSVIEDDKEVAVSSVNKTINKITADLKKFGIPASDIKTSNMSIYQQQEFYNDDNGVQKSRPGQWSVSNSVQVKLKDATKTNSLSDLLSASGATNVYGPNFGIDDSEESKDELYKKAFEDAKTKAELLASVSGQKIGKATSITMGNVSNVVPFYSMKADGIGGGGSELEQGTSSIGATVSVVFELKREF